MYSDLRASLSEEEDARLHRSMGLKMEQLKVVLGMMRSWEFGGAWLLEAWRTGQRRGALLAGGRRGFGRRRCMRCFQQCMHAPVCAIDGLETRVEGHCGCPSHHAS